MARVLKRETAELDLIARWVWYAENASVETANRFLAAADSTAMMLASQPESGVRVLVTKPELQGMRRFPLSDGFEKTLLCVVHASRDLEWLLSDGFFG